MIIITLCDVQTPSWNSEVDLSHTCSSDTDSSSPSQHTLYLHDIQMMKHPVHNTHSGAIKHKHQLKLLVRTNRFKVKLLKQIISSFSLKHLFHDESLQFSSAVLMMSWRLVSAALYQHCDLALITWICPATWDWGAWSWLPAFSGHSRCSGWTVVSSRWSSVICQQSVSSSSTGVNFIGRYCAKI